MAAMMLMIINFINMQRQLKFIIIHINAAISWPPPFISQPFHPEGLTLFILLGNLCVVMISYNITPYLVYFVVYKLFLIH